MSSVIVILMYCEYNCISTQFISTNMGIHFLKLSNVDEVNNSQRCKKSDGSNSGQWIVAESYENTKLVWLKMSHSGDNVMMNGHTRGM